MEIRKKIAHCSCCNTNCEINYGVENYDMSKLDKKNYINYKDIYIYTCPNCQFMSTDISGDDIKLYNLYKETDEFQIALNYKYLNGFNRDSMYERDWSKAYPANFYDAYSIMYSDSPNIEMKLRTLNKATEIKTNMKKRYKLDFYENDENELSKEEKNNYETLKRLIKQNIIISRENFISIAKKYDDLNVFLKLMLVENLCFLKNYSEAKKQFSLIQHSYSLSDDLTQYFTEILNKESK